MTEFVRHESGLFVPKPKPEPPKKKEPPKQWDCGHCGEHYDLDAAMAAGGVEEATVGSLNPQAIPHITCPSCKKCMGCCL